MRPGSDHTGVRLTIWFWVTALMSASFIPVGGDNPGPQYTTTPRYCGRDSDCHLSVGEVCWWYFDGCPRGQCMCDPRYAFGDQSGHCRARKLGEQLCSVNDRCPKGMTCVASRCLCNQGRLTPDRTYCVQDDERLLGQTCHPIHHSCLQRSARGYTTAEVECAPYGRCRCKEGYKQDGDLCRRWNIGEPGCSKDHQCQGGALCVDTTCGCPNGYLPVAGNSKCARFGATVELGLGSRCDEIGERLYCAAHLVCHQCEGQADYVCVHYSQDRFVSSGLRWTPTKITSVISTLFSLCIPKIITIHIPR